MRDYPIIAPARSLNRRQFLGRATAATATGLLWPAGRGWADDSKLTSTTNSPASPPANFRYKIGVCDWMILKRQKLGAFQLTKDIGADGVEVDMGSLGKLDTFDNQLAKPEVRQQFLDAAKQLNLEICSLAMSGFYGQPFAERPTVPRMVQDCIDTMTAMNVKVSFLPLGVSDLVKHPELRPTVVERLRAIAPKAEAARVVIGVESELDAAAQVALLKEINSPAIQ